MPVTRRAGATGNAYFSGATSGTITPGATPQDGDTIVVVCFAGAPTTWTPPAGFEKQGPSIGGIGNTYEIEVYKKRARPSEPSSYTFTCSPAHYGSIGMATYVGAVDVGPIARMVYAEQGASSTVEWPDLEIPADNGAVLLGTTLGSPTATMDTPAGYLVVTAPGRSRMFDLLDPTVGILDIPAAAASAVETHTVVAMFLTEVLLEPVNVSAPVLSGNNWNGQPLVTAFGDWLGADSFDVVYKRDGAVI